MDSATFSVPGPTWVRSEILQEMTRPMIGHRSAEFKALFAAITTNLRPLFRTQQDVFVATASGTAVMEASLVNCVPRRVLVTTCGAFSERWFSIAQTLGLEADRLESEWGSPAEPDELAGHLTSRHGPHHAPTLTHN